MSILRRLILALALSAGIAPALAQAPGPVPALPDTERRTSYSISASTCVCAVNFALFGDGVDYQNWVEVFLNGVRVNYNDPSFGWTITKPGQPIGLSPLPITNAVLTFNSAQTGTVQIVGARRPRRTAQFSESRGVAARDLNQALSDIISQNREIWDKTNDLTGRALVSQPGVALGILPLPSVCAGRLLAFDVTGLIPQCLAGGPGNMVGPPSAAIGNIAFYDMVSGGHLGAVPAYSAANPGNAALYSAIASPPNGFSTIYNGFVVGIGDPIPANLQGGGNTIASQQAVTGTVTCKGGVGCNGISGYVEVRAPNPANGIAAFGQCNLDVAGGNCFGFNFISSNIDNFGTGAGVNINYLAGGEINSNFWKPVGGSNPTVAGATALNPAGNVNAMTIQGGGNVTGTFGNGIVFGGAAFPGFAGAAAWYSAIHTYAGAAVNAVNAGPAGTGNSQPSQFIQMQGVDGSGNVHSFRLFADSNGSGYMIQAPDAALNFEDGSGNVLMTMQAAIGGSHVALPALNTAGFLVNDVNGVLSSSTTIPSGTAFSNPVISGTITGTYTLGGTPSIPGSGITGTVAETHGGTNQTAYVLGDTLYSPSANTLFRLPGNTTATKKFYTQTGTGSVSAAPGWNTIATADLPSTAVTPASYGSATQSSTYTVNQQGQITAAANVTITPAFSSVTGQATLAQFPNIAANTALANVTSGSAVPTAFAMPSCSTAGSALNYTSNSGFGCNSSITAANVTTNANLTGDVTSVGNATTLTNAPVIAKVLTGFSSGAGTVSSADSLLSAIQKLDGNIALKAPIASPTFTGTPAAPTAAVDTNTTQLATTAMVLGQAASATPLIDGTAAVGTSTRYARADHVHPTDTTRAALISPSFTTPSLGVATATTINGVALDNNAWSTYTPTVTAQTGTPTTATATGRYKQIGKTVFVQVIVVITTIGTASGAVQATLPVNAAANNYVGSCFEQASTGKSAGSYIFGASAPTLIQAKQADATTWWVNGYQVVISATYEAA